MSIISRRSFLGAGAMALTSARRMHADPLGMPIGCQTFPYRDALGKDVEGTLRQVAAIGYRRIELCSPPSYQGGYAPLLKYKAPELRQVIQAAGLECESCHYGFPELKNSLDERIAFAKDLGLKQMVLASFGLRPGASLADWLRACDDLNRIGEQIVKAGLQAGYHNHDGEFHQLEGALIYDKMMGELDPKMVKMQFQVSVISMGFEAATYLTRYPGRFLSLHLQDWAAAEKREVPIGQGIVDWRKLFAAAKKGGIRNYFVELPMEMLQPSYQYLHNLKV